MTTAKLPNAVEFGLPVDATGYTFFCPNYMPGESFAYFPSTGTVQLNCSYGQPQPTNVYIFHQGGSTTQVTQGVAQYSVNAGDYLIIQGPAASCKIAWFYL